MSRVSRQVAISQSEIENETTMGALLTRPLREYSSLELSTAVEEQFGSEYTEYARSMRENGVDGALLEGMDEAQIVETF
jgi:hypothetical protein